MKNNSAVEQRIIETALKMFNESGIEYVGMRELANSLGMRIGNLTYYFPTKDDLVNKISLELAKENSSTIVSKQEMNIDDFFEMLRQVFINHLKYRCLMLSFVHIMERNSLVAKRYSKTQSDRNEVWSKNIQTLKENKYITADTEEVNFLVSSIALIARFWISEATISFKHWDEEKQMRHYLKMIARIFYPYATAKGKKELKVIMDE